MYQDRAYCVFNVSELGLIDFDQVQETSADTVRRSVDGTLTFVKWDGEQVPECVTQLTTAQPLYNHTEILELLSGPVWANPLQDSSSDAEIS